MNRDPDTATGLTPSKLERYQSLLKPLLIGCAAAVLAYVFAKLGSEIGEGETHFFDMQVLELARSLRAGHPWLASVMRDLSGLGSTAVLTLFTVATVGYLALVSARATAVLVLASVMSGSVLVSVFKAAFGRVRPDIGYAEFMVPSLSFPSGHASMSAIVFLTLGVLIAVTRRRLAERAYILMTASLLTALVGLSRVALGVHWATDVLGGWAFGAAWAIAWLLLARQLARRA
ncbi:MAG: phosphatase PAP2 family protein [Pseudomonadota bacterium]